MDDWIRIGDDDVAPFGVRLLHFAFPDGSYSISIDQSDQDNIEVQYLGKVELWPIDLKHRKGNEFRLSGSADWTPELMDDHCWFELFFGNEVKITYWDDRVVYRTDYSTPEV